MPARPAGTREGGAANFRELTDGELSKLSDERLVAYIVKARAAGRLDAAVKAARLLAWSYERRITAFVYKEMGGRGETSCEEVIGRILESALKSAEQFDGTTREEFGGWIFMIARRRITDYIRERDRRVTEVPSAARTKDGATLEREPSIDDPSEDVDARSVLRQVIETRSDAHKAVVILGTYGRTGDDPPKGLSHKQVASEVNRQLGDRLDDPMTEQNVSQILSRFRKDLHDALVEAEDPPPPDENDDADN